MLYDMLRTMLLDAFGIKPPPPAFNGGPLPNDFDGPAMHMPGMPPRTPGMHPGYPVFDATGMVPVTEDHFGIL